MDDNKRLAEIKRETYETKIKVFIDIDGNGKSEIDTSIGFFDHMLENFSKHGFFELKIQSNGDTHVDCHHTVEDVGIVLGMAVKEALGDKKGIKRYGQAIIPMEEALVLCAIDISGRPFLNFDANFTIPMLGEMQTEMVEEFFRAFCLNSGINLHIKVLDGKNNHHICECIFKAFAKALDSATLIDERIDGVLSTKGMI